MYMFYLSKLIQFYLTKCNGQQYNNFLRNISNLNMLNVL